MFPLRPPSFRLWLRLYAHALLLESRIFPNVELHDESLDYMPTGFADIWKGNHHGEPVSIKAIRTQDLVRLKEIRRVCNHLIYQRRTEHTSCQTFNLEVNGRRSISHPNVLPVIEISETLFPFCIMGPWMSNGNITQYTNMNPGANRLMLVLAHRFRMRSIIMY